jgi:uncharacterized protein YhaN
VRINALEVDGFGVWTELKLDPLSEGLTVFYGPNEAGKTTLLEFIRSVLYGFSPERRRYLPPVHGGKPGGSLWVSGPGGQCEITRHASLDPAGPADELLVFTADGARHGEAMLKALLCNVDESVFNNVFAVGLRELQELAVLKETEAAAMLYNLTVGLDSVSLVEVMRELVRSRNRLVDAAGGPCQVAELVVQRETVLGRVAEAEGLGRRYASLAEDRGRLQREIARLENEKAQLGRELRLLDLAAALADRWQKRKLLDQQCAALEPAEKMPAGVVERFGVLTAALKKRRRDWAEIKRQREQLCSEAAGLRISDALLASAPRIEALQEQQHWLASLETQVSDLEAEIGQAEAGLKEEQERLGVGSGGCPTLAPRSLAAMRRPARILHRASRKLDEARRQLAEAEATAAGLSERVRAALAARGQKDLGEATDRAGGLVAQLRRREQLEERIQQMHRRHAELEQQTQELMDREMLPVSIILALGGVFVAGAVLVLLKLWEWVSAASLLGDLGWPLALLGLLATAAAVVVKFMLEQSNARQIEAAQRQTRLLDQQIRQSGQERDALDRLLSAESGSGAGQLRAAERELAGLEELVPLDAQRKAAQREAENARQRVQQAQSDLAAATRRWDEAVAAAGLPAGMSPKQVRQVALRCHQIGHWCERLQQRREELQKRSEELRTLSERIAELAREVGVGLEAASPIDRLRAMSEELTRQKALFQQRQALVRQHGKLRRRHARLDALLARLKHRRRILLDEVGAADGREFRRRAESYQQAQTLYHQRDQLAREIQSAIAGQASEEELGTLLEGQGVSGIEARRGPLQSRLAACEVQLRQRLEKRGQLAEQLRLLAEDRTPALAQLELAAVEKRLGQAVRRWQVLAATAHVLETVRQGYERTRQPECLQEASAHLRRMTEGRYQRVWTPLADDVLLVDDAAGKPLPVERLSHGVREQLFLSLRLALAGSYARRGAQLPMILDDVLVNFDASRVRAAAGVLCELAATGYQLLVFTCHEHIARLFDEMDVEVKELPDHAEPRPVARPRRTERKLRKRRAPAAGGVARPVAAASQPAPVTADEGVSLRMTGRGTPVSGTDGNVRAPERDRNVCPPYVVVAAAEPLEPAAGLAASEVVEESTLTTPEALAPWEEDDNEAAGPDSADEGNDEATDEEEPAEDGGSGGAEAA